MTALNIATNPAYSIKVSANAGTGKTYILTQRVLRLMMENIHPSKILCLTYTKAAAAEMMERVSNKLEEWAVMPEDKLKEELFALLQTKPDAEQIKLARKLFTVTLESTPPPRIQTIHSFCQEILTRFPLEAGITPNSVILDSGAEKELIFEAKTRLLANTGFEDEVTNAINYFTQEISEHKFSAIIHEIISGRNRFKAANIPPKPVLNAADEINKFMAEKQADNLLAEFIKRLSQNPSKTNDEKRISLKAALAENKIDEYFTAFLTLENLPRKTIATKEALRGFEDSALFLQTEALEFKQKINELKTAHFTYLAYFIAQKFLEIYDNLKAANGYLDYNDLLYLTNKLLTESNSAAWVLYKLDGGIDHVMVDEAQDTSPEQWQIISAITDDFFSGESARKNQRTVFIVGDEKQSIYSFQGAEPKEFANVTESIRQKCIASGNTWHDVDLNISYRSTASVLQLVDNVFANQLSAINSNKNQIKHELHRIGAAGRVELQPIIKRGEKPEHENWHFPTEYYPHLDEDILLAERIALQIDDWLQNKKILESQNRPLNAGDILIILRSRGDLAELIIKKLKAKNIPVSGADRLKLAEHIAIQDLLALAKYTLFPKDDLNLASLLKSPLFGISEDELFEYCHNRTKDLWGNLPITLQIELDDIFNKADLMGVYELYSYVLDVLGGRKKFISRLGTEVNEVLDEFLAAALDFEKNHTASLQKFLHWFMFASSEIKRDLEQSAGQVRVMTVHASKGLQAPIVFIADAASKPEGKGKEFLWYENDFYAAENSATASALYNSLKEMSKQESYNEYLRLLYVAMTRAADELYICGTEGDRKIADDCWYNIILPVISELGEKHEDGSFVIQNPQTQPVKDNKKTITEEITANLPDYIFTKLERKQAPQSQPKIFLDVEAAARGRKIHKMLEHGVQEITNAEVAEIIKNGRSEVPLISKENGRIKTMRLDVLWVRENDVIVLDHKTAKNPPSTIPAGIAEQMQGYEAALKAIYPQKTIKKYVYWTETGRLDEVA